MNFIKLIDHEKHLSIINLTKFEILFCLAYFLVALIMCIYSTPEGSLFSPDSAGLYAPIAEAFNHNHNFLVYSQPIYPMLIAFGMDVGLNLEQSMGIVPILCYSLLGFFLLFLGKIASRPLAGYITCTICLFCGKYLLYYSNSALTDMVYLPISVIAMYFLMMYNKNRSIGTIASAGLFTLFTVLTRNIGVALFFAGVIVIIANNREIKKLLTHLVAYGTISLLPLFYIWMTPSRRTYLTSITTSSSNPSINIILNNYWETMAMLFYHDYKLVASGSILIMIIALIIMHMRKDLIIFVKNTAPLTSYIFIYSFMIIIATSSSFWVSMQGVHLDVRKLMQIYPFVVLVIVLVFLDTYDLISTQFTKKLFKSLSIILLICFIAQGANALFAEAKSIRTQSINDHIERELFSSYISEHNLTAQDKIYRDATINWPIFQMEAYEKQIRLGFVWNQNPKESILDNLTLSSSKSAHSLTDLIKENKYNHIYIIVPYSVAKRYLMDSSRDICLCNPKILPRSIIYEAKLKCNKSCSSDSMGDISFLSGMADAFTARHQYSTAFAFATNATKLKPNDKNSLLREGNLLWLQKRYNESITKYRNALNLDPQSTDAWMRIGDMLKILKDYNASIESYRKVLEIDSNNTSILSNMIDDYRILKDYSNASAVAADFTEFNPENKANWLIEGNLLGLQKRYNESIDKYDHALAIDPHYKDAWIAKGRVLSQLGNYNNSLKAYDKVIELDPNNKDVWIAKAQVLDKMGNSNESMKAYNKAVDINPKNPSTWLTYGSFLEKKRRYNESLNAYEEALKLDPNNMKAWTGEGRVLSRLGNYNDSLKAYDKAIEQDPNNKDAWIAKAQVLDIQADFLKLTRNSSQNYINPLPTIRV